MNSQEIFEKLKSAKVSEDCEIIYEDGNLYYFGKNSDGNILFMIPSKKPGSFSVPKETKSLIFVPNKTCTLKISSGEKKQVVDMLVCKEEDDDKLLAFINLTKVFVQDKEEKGIDLSKLFNDISSLFADEKKASEIELQGLYAELYTMVYFSNLGCDVFKYWQSVDKMKFDFSISEKKRMEIKSTTKPNRIHHFRHDQLQTGLYDIKVVSIMLQKNDTGESLGELIEEMRNRFANDYDLLLRIEKKVSSASKDELFNLKYDVTYTNEKICFYDAKEIPHFSEKTPEGVSHVEYDCTMDNSKSITKEDMILWITQQ